MKCSAVTSLYGLLIPISRTPINCYRARPLLIELMYSIHTGCMERPILCCVHRVDFRICFEIVCEDMCTTVYALIFAIFTVCDIITHLLPVWCKFRR